MCFIILPTNLLSIQIPSELSSGREAVSQFLPCPLPARTCFGYNNHGYRISTLWFDSQTLFHKTHNHAYGTQDVLLPTFYDTHQRDTLSYDQQAYLQAVYHITCKQNQGTLSPSAAFAGLYAVLGITIQIIRLALISHFITWKIQNRTYFPITQACITKPFSDLLLFFCHLASTP